MPFTPKLPAQLRACAVGDDQALARDLERSSGALKTTASTRSPSASRRLRERPAGSGRHRHGDLADTRVEVPAAAHAAVIG